MLIFRLVHIYYELGLPAGHQGRLGCSRSLGSASAAKERDALWLAKGLVLIMNMSKISKTHLGNPT